MFCQPDGAEGGGVTLRDAELDQTKPKSRSMSQSIGVNTRFPKSHLEYLAAE